MLTHSLMQGILCDSYFAFNTLRSVALAVPSSYLTWVSNPKRLRENSHRSKAYRGFKTKNGIEHGEMTPLGFESRNSIFLKNSEGKETALINKKKPEPRGKQAKIQKCCTYAERLSIFKSQTSIKTTFVIHFSNENSRILSTWK